MNGNKIIVHTLIKVNDKYLVTKRSKEETTYPNYWDIPGGLAELGELPTDALKREVLEEVNLVVEPTKIIHEDSNLDIKKDTIYIRLVYLSNLISNIDEIVLDEKEHSEYKLISDLQELNTSLVAPFLINVFKEIKK